MDTREAILETADRLFNKRGIQQVGMDELRRVSGVSLKRLYAEFSSKDAIVSAVLERRHTLWLNRIDEFASRHNEPRDKLLSIFDFLAEWFGTETFRGCAFINAFGELGGTSKAVAEAAEAHKQSFVDYTVELACRAGGDERLGRQLVLLAEGAQTMSAITGQARTAADAHAAAEVLIAAAID